MLYLSLSFFFKEKKNENFGSRIFACPQVKLEAEEYKSRIKFIFQHNFLWRTREKNAEEK
jgi:hypothetical protein